MIIVCSCVFVVGLYERTEYLDMGSWWTGV